MYLTMTALSRAVLPRVASDVYVERRDIVRRKEDR